MRFPMHLQVKGELEQDDVTVFFGCFKHLASKTDVDDRRSCAQQFGQLIKVGAAVLVFNSALARYQVDNGSLGN